MSDRNNENNDRVLVLLSMYNGERFLREQLDSLLKQTVPVYILIRDDGSSDNSLTIAEEYSSNYDNICIIKGENIGFVRSFNSLIMNKMVDDYQWIAFCDQDDVWLDNKLEVALNRLKLEDEVNVPAMYCSNLLLADEQLNTLGMMHPKTSKVLNSCMYVQNIATGCTIVFNRSALLKYRQGIDIDMVAHDYMMYSVCKFFGKVLYDHDSYILYRQHSNNTIGHAKMTIRHGLCNVVKDYLKPKPELRVNFINEFVKAYEFELSSEAKMNLLEFVNYKKNEEQVAYIFDPLISGYELKQQ